MSKKQRRLKKQNILNFDETHWKFNSLDEIDWVDWGIINDFKYLIIIKNDDSTELLYCQDDMECVMNYREHHKYISKIYNFELPIQKQLEKINCLNLPEHMKDYLK